MTFSHTFSYVIGHQVQSLVTGFNLKARHGQSWLRDQRFWASVWTEWNRKTNNLKSWMYGDWLAEEIFFKFLNIKWSTWNNKILISYVNSKLTFYKRLLGCTYLWKILGIYIYIYTWDKGLKTTYCFFVTVLNIIKRLES